VLLDEIEKAHRDTFNVLLQVLDEGRLTDNKGRIADFKNTIIIMTSNIGSHIIQEKFETNKDIYSATETARVEVLGLLRKTICPEFLNRIDDIIMFTPLSKKDIVKIVGLQIDQLKKMLSKQNITLDATDEAINYLAAKGYDPQYGARPIKRIIQKEVLNTLSKELLSGKITADSVVLIDSFNDTLVFRNQTEIA
jgi:ATP-dependent Clp protease ATP-binding subunit ClpB